MLSQQQPTTTTTTTKSPADRPMRRVSWDRKHVGNEGGFDFDSVYGDDERGMGGNDDPEYEGGFGNQLGCDSSLFIAVYDRHSATSKRGLHGGFFQNCGT